VSTRGIHTLPPGHRWVDEGEVLLADDLVEWSDKSSTWDRADMVLDSCVGHAWGNEKSAWIKDTFVIIRKTEEQPVSPPVTLQSILDRREQSIQARLGHEAKIDFYKMYDFSPISQLKRQHPIKEQVIKLMKDTRERVLQSMASKVHTDQDVWDAFVVGHATPNAIKLSAAVQQLGERIDGLQTGRTSLRDMDAIRQMVATLRSGVEYLEQSIAAATEQYLANSGAQFMQVTLVDGMGGDRTEWVHLAELQDDPTAASGPTAYRKRVPPGEKWHTGSFRGCVGEHYTAKYEIHAFATPDEIAQAGLQGGK
jgi:hypothetical protein